MAKVTRGFHPMGDRYVYDFKCCTSAQGWAQLDTAQDASYYGNWVNPTTFEAISYCEGDSTHTQYESEEEFIKGLTETLQWHTKREYNPKIDGMCNPQIIEAFTHLGFEQYLY